MQPKTLEKRVETLEYEALQLRDLPERMGAIEGRVGALEGKFCNSVLK